MSASALGELLLRANIINAQQLSAAMKDQQQWGTRLGSSLVRLGILTEDALAQALSHVFQMPRVALGPRDPLSIPSGVLERIDRAQCERLGALPIGYVAERQTLRFAVVDPTNQAAVEDLGRQLGVRVEAAIANESQLLQAITRAYANLPGAGFTGVVPPYMQTSSPSAPFGAALPESPSSTTLTAVMSASLAAAARAGAQHAPDELRAAAEQQRRAARALAELLVERGVLDPTVLQRARS
jgi:hypothetical protein